MKKILILGAGLSTASLIDYLLYHSTKHNWVVRVGDLSIETASKKVKRHPNGTPFQFDSADFDQLSIEVANADVVISMLPAFMHPIIAKECVKQSKSMLTASYVSESMSQLHVEAESKGITLLNELGVDPGIDHMSAMKVIDEIKTRGGKMLSFISNTGGLIAPESDNNPWNYKFTWNPRNVVLAGQGVAQYKEDGMIKIIPYQRLFERTFPVEIMNLGEFEAYANRDSLSYQHVYSLEDIPSIFRGTIRRKGYSKAWNLFVQLGLTDDSYKFPNSHKLTHRSFLSSFLANNTNLSVEERLKMEIPAASDPDIFNKLKWLGIFEEEAIPLTEDSPAQILQHILEKKWSLEPNDKDMIVMQHKFVYEINGKKEQITSSMVIKGKDQQHTAMAITVGTPLAIATKLLLTDSVAEKGVVVPTKPYLYLPILKELETYGITFVEEKTILE